MRRTDVKVVNFPALLRSESSHFTTKSRFPGVCSRMAELQLSRTSDIRTRVEDYLNDKVQTAADLDQLDSLLQQIQGQQNLLKQQVRSNAPCLRHFSDVLYS